MCDGRIPCMRCATRDVPSCKYELCLKEGLVKQIKELKVKDGLANQILYALSTHKQVPEILCRLKAGEAYDVIVECLVQAPRHDDDTSSDQIPKSISSPHQWTTITSDQAVLDHLFQLYFSWVHPVYTLFSEGHFVDSYRRQSDQYCSSTLVNSICAMACHIYTNLEVAETDFEHLGQSFSEAVRAGIDAEDKRITTIQAFAVMFLVDCARGKALSGAPYLDIASKSLPKVVWLGVEDFVEVLTNTSRGIQSLSIEWAQMTFRVPMSFTSAAFESNEEKDIALDNANWYFYQNATSQCLAWPSLLATTNNEKAKLIDIINDVTTLLYRQQSDSISAHQVLKLYKRYLAWRKELPLIIGDIDGNKGQTLPHVLSLFILYSSSVIQLLQPLLSFESFPSAVVKEVIWHHAQQSLFIIDQCYRRQYNTHYQPVLQVFAMLHLCDVIARFFPEKLISTGKDGTEAIQQGIESLMQLRPCYPIAGPLQELLLRTANECSILLPNKLSSLIATAQPPKMICRIDDFIDACTRPTYKQPVKEIHFKYQPSFAIDWMAEAPSLGVTEPDLCTRRSKAVHAENEAFSGKGCK